MIAHIAPPPLRLFTRSETRSAAAWRQLNAPEAPTCINVDVFEYALRNCPNRVLVQFVLSGLRIGFCKPLAWTPSTLDSANHPSIDLAPDELLADMHAEITLGRRTGPYSQSDIDKLPYYRVNPLGLVPKPRSTKYRLIHDHSFPQGESNNDAILRSDFGDDFTMDRIDVVVRNILSMGKGCLMWTEDVASAYRILNVHDSHKPLQGMRLSGFDGVFFDHCLVFGSRESGFFFCYVAGLVCWYLQSIGLPYTSHYVDNFHGVVSNTMEGRRLRDIAIKVFSLLGIPLNPKDSDLGQVVRHLGFLINTVSLTVTIPQDKREILLVLLANASSQTQIPLKGYHSLVGKLVWASQIMPPARAYLSRLLALLRTAQQRHCKMVYILAGHRHDLLWFQRTLTQWDGVYIFDNLHWDNECLDTFAGDATPLWGGGVYTSTLHFSFYSFCPACIAAGGLDSQSLEMANTLISVLTLGQHAFTRRIMWLTDNQANVWTFAKGRADNTFITDCIRDILSYAIIRQIDIRLLHCPRTSSIIRPADDLSRGFQQKFLDGHPSHRFAIPIVPERFRLINESSSRIDHRYHVCFKQCQPSPQQSKEQ